MPVLSYSPSHTEIALLERLTTGTARHRLIETLVEVVRSEVGRESHQHQILIGPRGGGKTHALTLIAHRLRTDPELASQTFPVVLAEEEVASQPADLMRRVVDKLVWAIESEAKMDLAGRNTALRECRSALSAFRFEDDDERALNLAVGALEAAATALGRLLVIVIENLHTLLYAGPGLSRRTAIHGQWGLRRTLLEARGLLILGGAPSLFGEVTSPSAPFYDFFRMHHLSELSPEDMLVLIRTRLSIELDNEGADQARRKRLEALNDNFDQRVPRLRGILTLTGGLPRFAHLLFDLLANTDIASVAGTISCFLDEQTPYFQNRLDPRLIPEGELEVLDVLASAPGPLTIKEISAQLRAKAPNAVATFLKRLRERGFVRSSGNSRRDTHYDLTEPLFRVWRRFRLGRTEREQIISLAEFITAMFDREEIEADLKSLQGKKSGSLRRQTLEMALMLNKPQITAAAAEEGSEDLAALEPDVEGLLEDASTEMRKENFEQAYALYQNAIDLMSSRGHEKAAARHLGKSALVAFLAKGPRVGIKVSITGRNLSNALNDDIGRAEALVSLGTILLEIDRPSEAEDAFHDAKNYYIRAGEYKQHLICHVGLGLVNLSRKEWEKGVENFVFVYRNDQSSGSHLLASKVSERIWIELARLSVLLDSDRLAAILRRVHPLLQDLGKEEFLLNQAVGFLLGIMSSIDAKSALSIVRVLEEGLPESHSGLFRPARLATEVLAGERSADLPEEPEEVRRAMREVLDQISDLQSAENQKPSPRKKKRTGR